MKNILLVCGAGMSTSLLVKKMKAADMKHQYYIQCTDTVSAQFALMKTDMFLLAPHIGYMKDEFIPLCEKRGIPFMVIDSLDYTKMDGVSVLKKVSIILNDLDQNHIFKVILLHSRAGAMSDLLAMDMNKKKNDSEKDWIIKSIDIELFDEEMEVDIILLEPQICFEEDSLLKKLKNKKTKVYVPSRQLYGAFDGRKILNFIHQMKEG
ncbi:hypothetical protein [Candidatus Stoquefichus massiliensis]|uniref:hypothetical protein n=1 Tax=Candidatus Stoquefichus massiliensis TaxID=1470350 RepID=UPI0004B442D3|nr:hypothetical protein [Candidatus Stoquefichus massiliensis]